METYRYTWLDNRVMYRELRQIAKTWPSNQELGLILFEAWSAAQRVVPFPHVCVLYEENRPVGVLCGSVSWDGCFAIHRIAIPSGAPRTEDIYRAFIDLAIDVSQDAGFHGWVSCVPEEGRESVWREFGFYRHHDGITYRRMGHFSRV